MENKMFNLKSNSQFTFRFTRISPIELLALQTQINLEDFEQTQKLFTFILEKTEVQIGQEWFPVKMKGKEVYSPSGIEDNMDMLNEIIYYFMDNVIKPTFMKSSASN